MVSAYEAGLVASLLTKRLINTHVGWRSPHQDVTASKMSILLEKTVPRATTMLSLRSCLNVAGAAGGKRYHRRVHARSLGAQGGESCQSGEQRLLLLASGFFFVLGGRENARACFDAVANAVAPSGTVAGRAHNPCYR